LIVHLSRLKVLAGECDQVTNPEQLFAAGYAACFQSALMQVAHRQQVDTGPSTITAKVVIGPTGGGGFELEVELHISMPEVDKATSEKLVELAHQGCTYSHATCGNIPIKLILEEQSLA
jgi:lipoyl-dependent peroxiredoxin